MTLRSLTAVLLAIALAALTLITALSPALADPDRPMVCKAVHCDDRDLYAAGAPMRCIGEAERGSLRFPHKPLRFA